MKAADKVEYEDLFSELLATVKVPEPLNVAPGIVLECPTKEQVNKLLATEDEAVAQEIIFKDNYDAAMKLFDGMPMYIWNAFMTRYNEHFFLDKDLGK